MFREVEIEASRFVREMGVGQGNLRFVSTIKSGEGALLDCGDVERLHEGSFLTLHGFCGRVQEMHVHERINLRIEGMVRSVLIGPEGYQRDLTPSHLKYLSRNRQLALLRSALVFVWSLGWSTKRFLTT